MKDELAMEQPQAPRWLRGRELIHYNSVYPPMSVGLILCTREVEKHSSIAMCIVQAEDQSDQSQEVSKCLYFNFLAR